MFKHFLIGILLLSGAAMAQSYTGQVVKNDNLNTPIPFAKLYFVDLNVGIQCDSAGNWQIENIPAGANRIQLSAPGFETEIRNVDLSEGSAILKMDIQHRSLDKVIVSNNGLLQRESITNIESHRLSDINLIPMTSIGEALANIPGVSQTGIGPGIRKPIIRGLSGSSVVTYVNGLRIQNQQWGGDHGLPITSLGIGSVEVIKGPASLLYGADALGGVIYFVDEPYAARNTWEVSAGSQFEQNTLGTSNQLGVKYSKNSFKLSAYGGYDNHADYKLPNGNQVTNSRFKQSSGKLALGYNHKKWAVNLRYNFYNGRLGLPGHTHDPIVTPEAFQTTNQNRKDNVPAQVIQNHFTSLEINHFGRRNVFSLTLGNTNNSLKEHEEKFTFADIVINLNNSLYNAKWKLFLTENTHLIVGSQGMFQQNKNGAEAIEILIPDATTLDLGGYALIHAQLKKWHFQTGFRVDNRAIETDELTNFNQSYTGYNYSAGVARLGEKTTVRANVSSGFRAPNTSELLSDGVHHGTFRYERGNATLKTEKAIQLDASLALHFEDLEVIVNPFYNRIADYIYLNPTEETQDGFNVYEYSQAGFAQLYGIDAGFHYHPHSVHQLHIESSLSNVFAEDENKTALPLIPQSRINTQIRYDLNMKTSFRLTALVLQHQYFFLQNRPGVLETASPAYNLVNIGINAEVDMKHPLYISTGVRNVLNEEFIDHLSGLKNLGLPHPGLNFYFSLKIKISNTLKNKQ